jgi:predicted phage terminase large subunit-like protein
VILAGRGFGKTRAGAEWIRQQVQEGVAEYIALVAPTAADARDVMVKGESGIIACCRRYGIDAVYKPSLRCVEFGNGAKAFTYSAEEPDRLRGPQHAIGWADEIAAWKYPETLDQLRFGLRLGTAPQLVVTTTPRPIPVIRQLKEEGEDVSSGTIITTGSTFDNAANLPDSFIQALRARYEGTRLGRQELYAEVLDDVEGALWRSAEIERFRVRFPPLSETGEPWLARIVVAVDPAASASASSDATGIVVVGAGFDGHLYILDFDEMRATPLGWGRRALDLYREWRADALVIEKNQGGDMAVQVLRTAISEAGVSPHPRIVPVTATRGKTTRAEPIAALYEQGRVHHVGFLRALEEQMCAFPVATNHDDLVDALVWGATELSPETSRAGLLHIL